MHSRSVPTLMLAVLKFVKTLTSANQNKNRSTCDVHQRVKPKGVLSTQLSFGMKYTHYDMFM